MVPGGEDDGWRSAGATTPFPRATQPTNGSIDATVPAHQIEQRVGRYLLRALLGAGAMGEVWVATDPQLERDVAIKLVHPRLARYPDVSARMVREARAMAKVSHRGVIAIHDAGEADGELFLAMELVRGRTLGAILRERSADQLLDWRRWLAIVVEAGRGLAAAHAAGVLHRDFKPDNIMVDDHGRVCVGDFGLATVRSNAGAPGKLRLDADVVEPNLTMVGALLGTPAYMSLEQLRGDAIDARADQFCFCVTAYEAIYGESPFVVPPDELANLVALEESRLGPLRPPPVNSRVPLHAPPLREPTTLDAGSWLGSLASGDLVERDGPTNTLVLVRDGRTTAAWGLDAGWNHILAVSPDRTRFAYSTGDRFRQQIAVDDGAGHRWRSPPIADLAAVTWLDDRTLLYASGNAPALMAIDVGGTATARVIHTVDSGFIGRLAASPAGIVYMNVDPKLEVRVIARSPLTVRDIDPTYASAELGWTSDGACVVWNRSTRTLERVTANRHLPYPAMLDSEPINATIAGDLIIAAERNVGGRELVALSLSTGKRAWSDPIGQSFAARCAADLAPPCYVARRDDEAIDHYAIMPIDPASGRASGPPVYRGTLEDFAVSRDGRRILVATPNKTLVELDEGGARVASYPIEFLVRSVAYDPAGGMLLGVTTHPSYVVGHYDGTTFTPFNIATTELLSLVRPSPVTGDVLAQGRTFSASLWQLASP